jgi:hypothetical protein
MHLTLSDFAIQQQTATTTRNTTKMRMDTGAGHTAIPARRPRACKSALGQI